jgi:hypothetical protein
MEENMKREYSYFPIFGIIIINAIIAVILNEISENLEFIQLIVGIISNFLIFSGLLHTRTGGIGDYFSNIKRINANVIFVNIVSGIISALFLMLIISLSAVSYIPDDIYFEKSSSNIGIITALVIGTIIMELIFMYTNLVLADERNEELSFGASLKLVIKTGFNLTLETVKIFLKIFFIPVIFLIIVGLMTVTKSVGVLPTIAVIGLSVSIIYLVFAIPTYMARISDAYIDYTGHNIDGKLEDGEEQDEEERDEDPED